MKKMKIFLLLPTLFIFPYILGMDPIETSITSSDLSQFKSFSQDTLSHSTSNKSPHIRADGTSSGSGEDITIKPNNLGQADAFIIPKESQTKEPKLLVPLNLEPKKEIFALNQQEERREKIKKNFGENFVQESQKEEEIGAVINVLQQLNLDSTTPKKSSFTLAPQTPRRERTPSYDTFLEKQPSKEKILANTEQTDDPFSIPTKIPETILAVGQSPTPTPPNSPLASSTEIAPETPRAVQTPPPTPAKTPKEIPQICVTPPSTPSPQPTPPVSPRIQDTKNLADPSKTSDQETDISEHKQNTQINNLHKESKPTSVQAFTWKDRRIALLTITGITITGLLTLLYYLNRLPANMTTQIDNILTRFMGLEQPKVNRI